MNKSLKPTEPMPYPLTEDEWEELYKRLRLYTYSHFGYLQTQLKAGIDLEGVINDSLAAFLLGKRRRPNDLDIFFFICGVIRSKVYAITHSAEERMRICIEDHIEPLASDGLESFLHRHSQSKKQETNDQATQYSEIASVIRRCVQKDDILSRYVDELIDFPDQKPQDIAHKLKVPIEYIRNARKRLNRLIPKIKEALGYE